jgi:hypothetical protein
VTEIAAKVPVSYLALLYPESDSSSHKQQMVSYGF